MSKNSDSYHFDLTGPIVPILPAFDDNDSLNIDAVCGWVDALIARGIRLFWTTFGTTHFMCLTDDEVMELTRRVAEVTRGRAGFIASTAYHWHPDFEIKFCETCAGWGVDAVKIQNEWKTWPPSAAQMMGYYKRLNDTSTLPLLAYTFGAPGISVDTLKQILDLPRFIGMKNDTGDFYEQNWYQRTVREHATRPFAVMTGGTLESAMHTRHFGARAYASGLAVFAPAPVLRFQELIEAGDYVAAARIVSEIEQPVFGHMQRMGPFSHWGACHAALNLQGVFPSARLRYPLRTFDQEQMNEVRKLLDQHDLLGVFK